MHETTVYVNTNFTEFQLSDRGAAFDLPNHGIPEPRNTDMQRWLNKRKHGCGYPVLTSYYC